MMKTSYLIIGLEYSGAYRLKNDLFYLSKPMLI